MLQRWLRLWRRRLSGKVELAQAHGVLTPAAAGELADAPIPTKQITLFTRQLTALLSGGIPLVQSLGALTKQPECPDLGRIIADMEARVASGSRLSAALAQYPNAFGRLYVTMVQVGESTGDLDQPLERLAVWMERDEELRQSVRSSLTYPLFVLALSLVLTLLLFTTILPSFVTIFEEMGTPLPWITQLVVLLTKWVRNPLAWLLSTAGLVLLAVALQRIGEDEERRARLFSTLLQLPGIGGVLFHGTSARYCGALAVLLASGMDMRRALRLAGAASGSPVLERDSESLIQSVAEGSPMSVHMSQHPQVYSSTMAHLSVAGEEASKLPEMFGRAVYFHELELQARIEAVSSSLEPLLLTGVALVVGTILVSIFLPLYGILTTLG